MEVRFNSGDVVADVRGARVLPDGAVRAAVDFLHGAQVIFSHSAIWTDAAERGAVAQKLGVLTSIPHDELVADLLAMENAIAKAVKDAAGPAAGSQSEQGRAWPEPPGQAAFAGLAGRIVAAIDPHTEADPVAVLINFLVAIGNVVGGGPHFLVGATRHCLNLFAALVGDTSKARKGDSWSPIDLLFRRAVPDWAEMRVKSGLTSGEGLIWQVRDAIERKEPVKEHGRVVDYQQVIVDAGVEDKRLLLIEPEFARVLGVMDRSGNTLSPVIRQAWDRGDLDTLTKNSPARATGAHVSILAHVTQEELRRNLGDTEVANGFANRFLWFSVRRSKLLPEPQPFEGAEVDRLVDELRLAVERASAIGELRRDDDARAIWAEGYPELSAGQPGLAGAIGARAEAQTMRLAAIYALIDGSPVISGRHLYSALELWGYAERSIRHIWGDHLGDPVAATIASALQSNGRMSRTQISEIFGRHRNSARIDAALQLLLQLGKARSYSDDSAGGRPVQYWEPAA